MEQLLTTLIGAFMGAWFAFKIQDESERRKNIDNQVSAGNKALFEIACQLNTLTNVWEQVLKPDVDHPIRNVKIPPVLPIVQGDYLTSLDSLAFLLETEHRQVLLQMGIEQQQYAATKQCVDARSTLHYEKIQPCLENLVLGLDAPSSLVAYQRALGPRLWQESVVATTGAIEAVANNIESLKRLHSQLLNALQVNFSEHKFLGIVATEAA